jgi:transcriptional regulator with AAA-type ATPase domain
MAEVAKTIKRKLELFAALATCNPFLPQRIELEKKVLGDRFEEDGLAWSRRLEFTDRERFNVTSLTDAAIALIEEVKQQVDSGKSLSSDSLTHYWYVVIYALLYRHIVYQDPASLREPQSTAKIWKDFRNDYRSLVNLPGLDGEMIQAAGHLFAILCQVHRAFFNIYSFILGESLPSIELRGKVWQSIFTTDLERYRRSLFKRMGTVPSLITGPSGTGKELVARAIGLSQFIPFDEKSGTFKASEESQFFPLNLSALSANLIESELFGHRKGSFTGAVADRKGWLEHCPSYGAVFLDEIGELDAALQVKLLRVVQQRKFSRLGDTKEREFSGKIIGATNRDLDEEMKTGRFREDLYYRLCADRIETPSLRQQLDHRPEDLYFLIRHIVRGLVDDDSDSLCDQSFDWIGEHLGDDYPWRGNFRELEQCISSIMIRGEYVPRHGGTIAATSQHSWVEDAIRTSLTADELLQRYCTWMYFKTGGYEAAARKLKIDRRTVKAKIDETMLERLQQP